MHGDSIFEFISTDSDEYSSSYTKISDEVEKKKENPTDHDGKYNFAAALRDTEVPRNEIDELYSLLENTEGIYSVTYISAEQSTQDFLNDYFKDKELESTENFITREYHLTLTFFFMIYWFTGL